MKKSTVFLICGIIAAILCAVAAFVFKNFTWYDGALGLIAILDVWAYFDYKKKGE